MRLIDPVRGSVVETTDPRTIVHLVYGRGYWMADDDDTTQAEGDTATAEVADLATPAGEDRGQGI